MIGLGRLDHRCAELLLDDPTLGLAGVVRRTPAQLDWLGDLPVVGHFTELKQVDAALLCVPADSVQGQARELLQHRIPLVECARLHGDTFIAHHGEMQRMAHLYRTTAIVGAGSDPGILSLFRSQFALLLPHGHTRSSLHAGTSLHHSLAAEGIAGVRRALALEQRTQDGTLQRYIYVELEPGADAAAAGVVGRSGGSRGTGVDVARQPSPPAPRTSALRINESGLQSRPDSPPELRYARSKRSAFITLLQATTKSLTNFAWLSSWA